MPAAEIFRSSGHSIPPTWQHREATMIPLLMLSAAGNLIIGYMVYWAL
jgi:hypothetical protein